MGAIAWNFPTLLIYSITMFIYEVIKSPKLPAVQSEYNVIFSCFKTSLLKFF